jgi:uncharacterized membrane protein YagU involved in acid resistance
MDDNAIERSPDVQLRPRALRAILFGGLTVGVLDSLDAMLFFGLWYHITPGRIWQSVASGVLGRERAVQGGMKTVLLGLFLHFMVATCIAAVFSLGTLVAPALLRHPVIWGLLFGVASYFVMTHVVVPLSAVPPRGPAPWPSFLNGVIGHALLVGLPIALVARWTAKKQ